MVKNENKKVRKKSVPFVVPATFVEGVVSLGSITIASRKTQIDYPAIKAQLETKLPNGETPVLFMKKSTAGMSALKATMQEKYPALKLQLIKSSTGQTGIAIKPTNKA
jgi:hypothetical protein